VANLGATDELSLDGYCHIAKITYYFNSFPWSGSLVMEEEKTGEARQGLLPEFGS
jgi:hypothetical protein